MKRKRKPSGIVVDEAELARVRAMPCDWCGNSSTWVWRASHHIVTRQMGGGRRLDIKENLLSVCEMPNGLNAESCHQIAHKLDRDRQFELAAAREGMTAAECRSVVEAWLRPKHVRKGTA